MENALESIKNAFLKKNEISTEEIQALLTRWNKKKHLKKNEFLCDKGQVETYLYFVISGVLRIYYLHDGSENCAGFAYPNTFICAYPSFIKNEPSVYYMEALTSMTLIGISRKDFYNLMEISRAIEKCWRLFTEEALLGRIQRELEMLTFTPEERYRKLWERSNHVFQLVPQKYIASYLGMTPETFSRIKKKILKS